MNKIQLKQIEGIDDVVARLRAMEATVQMLRSRTGYVGTLAEELQRSSGKTEPQYLRGAIFKCAFASLDELLESVDAWKSAVDESRTVEDWQELGYDPSTLPDHDQLIEWVDGVLMPMLSLGDYIMTARDGALGWLLHEASRVKADEDNLLDYIVVVRGAKPKLQHNADGSYELNL